MRGRTVAYFSEEGPREEDEWWWRVGSLCADSRGWACLTAAGLWAGGQRAGRVEVGL